MLGYLLGKKQALFVNITEHLTKNAVSRFQNRVNVFHLIREQTRSADAGSAYLRVGASLPLKMMPNFISLPVCQPFAPRKKARILN
jgi:hypothetical protein